MNCNERKYKLTNEKREVRLKTMKTEKFNKLKLIACYVFLNNVTIAAA